MNQYPTMPPTRGGMLTSANQTPGITPAVRALMKNPPATTGPYQPPAQVDTMAQGASMAPGVSPVQPGQAMGAMNNLNAGQFANMPGAMDRTMPPSMPPAQYPQADWASRAMTQPVTTPQPMPFQNDPNMRRRLAAFGPQIR